MQCDAAQTLRLKVPHKMYPYSFIYGFSLLYFVTTGSKPMDTWCGEDVNMGNSWDQEEEVEIGMWNNSQQDNRPNDQNTWNYKHKGSYKVSRVCSCSKCKPRMHSGSWRINVHE